MAQLLTEGISSPNHDILGEMSIDKFGATVRFVGPTDYRVPRAIEMEIDNMAMYDDPREEVREEFLPYADQSLFLLAYEAGQEPSDDNLKAMARLVSFSADESDGEVRRNKTIKDLAIIKSDEHVITDSSYALMTEFENRFIAETGITDFSKVVDVGTFALDLELGRRGQLRYTGALMTAIAQHLVNAQAEGKLAYVTSFNEVGADKVLRKYLGFPFNDLFGFGPVKYTTQSDKGMTAQPAYGKIEDMRHLLADPNSRISRSLGEVDLSAGFEVVAVEPRPRSNGVTRMLGVGARLLLQ